MHLNKKLFLTYFHLQVKPKVSERVSEASDWSEPRFYLEMGGIESEIIFYWDAWQHSYTTTGLAHRKNSLTLHCFLTWNSNQSDKISPPYPPDFGRNQVSHTPTDRSGPELSADIARWQAPGNFFSGYTGLNTGNAHVQGKTWQAPFSKITKQNSSCQLQNFRCHGD